jgi:two-component system, LytTR family, response regulator
MRVLIVDDEPLARTALSNYVSERNDIDGFDAVRDAVEALDKISHSAYDILLLDINMPEISGFDLLERLQSRGLPLPAVVFVTAHSEYAVRAFEKHAVDYVLKPFSPARIDAAMARACRRTAGERAVRIVETLPQLQELVGQRASRIAIKAKGRIIFLDPHDVQAVEAEGNYVLLQRESGSYLARESISEMEETLKPHGFIRIHRSVLVNSAFVEDIRPCATGEYELRLKRGKVYMVTRTYKKNLRGLAATWIATRPLIAE